MNLEVLLIDFILVGKGNLRCVKDVKIIPDKECAPQYESLVFYLVLNFKIPVPIPFIRKRQVWRLCDPGIQMDFLQKIRTLSGSYNSA